MDWYATVFETIDMRSFSNLWFWIMLAVIWSSASHFVLGVPYDMVTRAARRGGQAEADLHVLATVNANRALFIAEEAGLAIVAIASAAITALALLGFVYDREFAQALFLLALPLSVVTLLNVRTARAIAGGENAGAPLRRRMRRHRALVQAIGLVSIFVTAVWGMYQNLGSPFL